MTFTYLFDYVRARTNKDRVLRIETYDTGGIYGVQAKHSELILTSK